MTNKHTPAQELITKTQLAKKLKVTTKTIENWTKDGLIPVIKINTQVRYNWSEVLEQLNKESH